MFQKNCSRYKKISCYLCNLQLTYLLLSDFICLNLIKKKAISFNCRLGRNRGLPINHFSINNFSLLNLQVIIIFFTSFHINCILFIYVFFFMVQASLTIFYYFNYFSYYDFFYVFDFWCIFDLHYILFLKTGKLLLHCVSFFAFSSNIFFYLFLVTGI